MHLKAPQGLLGLLILFSACKSTGTGGEMANTLNAKGEGDMEGAVSQYYENGQTKSRTEFKDNQKHGWEEVYYPNGNLQRKSQYNMGVKDGVETEYYQEGVRYQTIPYEDGYINGIVEKYRPNQMLFAQIPYSQSMPGTGLREFTLTGKPITRYPTLKVQPQPQQGQVALSLDPPNLGAQFYVGQLAGGQYFNADSLQAIPSSQGKAHLAYNPNQGRQTWQVVVYVTSTLKNPYIFQQEVTVPLR